MKTDAIPSVYNSAQRESHVLGNNGEQWELSAKDTVINMETLSEHLSEQPGLVAYYGNVKSIFQERVNTLKTTIELFMAAKRTELRNAAEGKRTYKEELNDAIMATDEYIELVKELHMAESSYEKAAVFFQAMRDKGMALNSLCSVYKAELFVNDKVMENTFREKRREKFDSNR